MPKEIKCQNDAEEAVQQIVENWVELARVMSPAEFRAALGGSLGTLLGSMPQDYWEKFTKIEPCGQLGCDCHLHVVPAVVKLFTLLRQDFQNYGPHQQTVAE